MPAKESTQPQVAILPNRMHFLSDGLRFGQTFDPTSRYGRHRVSTALPSAPVELLSARRARLGKGPLLRKPLCQSLVLRSLPAGSDTARAAPGAEAPAGARRGGAARVSPLQRKRVAVIPQIPLPAGTRVADRAQPGATNPPRERGARSKSLPFGAQPGPSTPCPAGPRQGQPAASLTTRGERARPCPHLSERVHGCAGGAAAARTRYACPGHSPQPLPGFEFQRPPRAGTTGRGGGARALAVIDRRAAQSGCRGPSAPARPGELRGSAAAREGGLAFPVGSLSRPGRHGWGREVRPQVLRLSLSAALPPWASLCCVPGVHPAMAALSQNLFGKDL